MDSQRRKRPGEDAFGIILLVVSLVLAWQSYKIAGFSALSSPGAFPLAASAAMVIAALIVVIGNLRRPGAGTGAGTGDPADKAQFFPRRLHPRSSWSSPVL
jgi:hypothetical protein